MGSPLKFGSDKPDAPTAMEASPPVTNDEQQGKGSIAAKRLQGQQAVGFLALFSFADPVDYLLMALGTLGALGHGMALPMFCYFFGKIVNGFGQFRNDPDESAREVGKYALYFVYLGLVVWVSSWIDIACWMHTGQRQASRIRLKYLEAILNQDVGFFEAEARTGMFVESISKDPLMVQDAISEKVGNFVQFTATFIGGFAVGFSAVWKICAINLAVVPAITFAGGLYTHTVTRLTTRSQAAYGAAGTIAEQTIAQIRTVYSFAGEEKAARDFSNSLKLTLTLGYTEGIAKGLGMGVTHCIVFFSWAFVFWYGGVLIRSGEADAGNAIIAMFSTILGGISLGKALSSVTAFGRGKAAAYKIFEMLEKPSTNKSSGSTLSRLKGDIELRNVAFSYPYRPDARIFEDFNLAIPSGKTVALVGSSGSGKSTVISLIERFYDPDADQVLLDGVDIRTLQLRWLRDQIGLVNQEPALFATSILENILYGKAGATMQEVEAAARAANAHTFINDLPTGYTTLVGDRGIQLSGGQKQRVAIARAVLKDPKVLLLDEATSALDAASERVVQEALDRLMLGRTSIVVAHRLSTIRYVDTIAVVQAGRIVEIGTHDELLARGEQGTYSSLVRLQKLASTETDGTVLNRTVRTSSLSSDAVENWHGEADAPLIRKEAKVVSEASAMKGSPFWRVARLNAPEWPYALLGSLGAILAGLMMPFFSLMMSELLTVYYDTDPAKMKRDVQKYVLISVGLGVATVGIYGLQHYYLGIVGENLTARVRETMFKAMLGNEVGWFDLEENNSKRLAARLASDATQVRAALGDRIWLLVQNTSVFFTACFISLAIQWRVALVLLATFPLLVGAAFAQNLTVSGFSGDLATAHSLSSMIAGDSISNIRTVAAFNAESKTLALFSSALRRPSQRSLLRGNLSGFFYGLSQMCMYSSYGLVLWYGSTLVKNSTVQFGGVIQVFMVLMTTAGAVAQTLSVTPDLMKASDALNSVFQIIDHKTQIDPDDPNAEKVEPVRGEIELRDVEFAYPTRPDVTIFKGLSLEVKAGESVALVGASGSGKSSIVGLLERFYDPTGGSVMVDGKDIRRWNLRWLRQHIGLVEQEAALFATTIYENISYGREGAKAGEVEEAARAANAHSFISNLPAGYATEVGEKGVQLSGGQKQRVAIARAVLKDPSILLLDEATSALDAESEKVVQEALERVMGMEGRSRTSFVIAHRLSTIRHVASIAVVQEGRVLEFGSHSQLISNPHGPYARLLNLQYQQ